jgi:hypothetical protein
MEYEMFGPGGFPDDHFRKGVRTLLAAGDNDWEGIEKWFLTTRTFEPDDAVSSPSLNTSGLPPDQIIESVETVQYILEAWHLRGLEFEQVQRDLIILGLSQDEIDRLSGLLQRLGPIRGQAYAHYMLIEHQNFVLPTLEDFDVVCDVRPVFEDFVYPPSQTHTTQHTKILDFTYMVLVELVTEDSDGEKKKLAFQMSEDALGEFEGAIKRAHQQLDILKEKTRGLFNENR